MDILSPDERSALMSKIGNKDTKPELVVRRLLHRMGYRFRLHQKRLPGKPDIVLAKWKAVILVHGCYWHRHPGCKHASFPKTDSAFWEEKFAANVERDRIVRSQLEALGWKVTLPLSSNPV